MCWKNLEHFLNGVNINAHPVSVLQKKKWSNFLYPPIQLRCVNLGNSFSFWTAVSERDLTQKKISSVALSPVFSTSCFQLPHMLCYKPKGCDSPHFLWKQIKDLKRLLNSIPASDFAAWKHWMSQLMSPCMWVYLLNTNGSWLETESWREVDNPLNWH